MEFILFPCAAVGSLISIGLTVFWIWMLIDAVTNEPGTDGNEKLIWILVIVFTTVIGAMIYYFVRRPERIRQYGK